MSSFRRRLARPYIAGTTTSPQTGQIITGSGNPALDELLGGGIPMNSIILIEEDKHCIYSKVLCKYFLAEGAIKSQKIILASLDDSPDEIFKKLPQPVFLHDCYNENHELQPDFDQLSQDTTSLRIAWRYNDLPYLNVEKDPLLAFGDCEHHFNLLNYMTENEVANIDKVLWDGTNVKKTSLDVNSAKSEIVDAEEEEDDESTSAADTSSFFSNKRFQNLIDTLAKELRMVDTWRICIPSLGSPLWYDENFGEDLLKFLTILRAYVQNTQSVCFLTMPMHLIAKSDELLVPKIRNLVDYAIELESFSESDRETNPAFKEYNGLLHFRKMSAINSLALFQHSDLAFKLRRKKFVIEKFHLPPELGESTEADSEDVLPKPKPTSCGHSSDVSLYY